MIHFLLNQCVALLMGYGFLYWTHSQPQDRLGTACLSYVSGICIWGTLSYIFDFWLTPMQASLIATGVCLPIALCGLRSLSPNRFMRFLLQNRLGLRDLSPSLIICGIALLALLWRIAKLVVFYDLGGGLFVAHESNFGDIAVHLHLANFFLTNPIFPPEAPYFANTPLRYPFLVDYIVALASPHGNVVTHMQIQSFLLFICCFGATRSATAQLFPQMGTSKKLLWLSFLAPLLIFTFEPGLEAALSYGGKLFTSKIPGIDILSIFYAHFISQRGMLLGFPLAWGVFTSVHRHILQDTLHTPPPQDSKNRTMVGLAALSSLVFLAYSFCYLWLLLLCLPYTLPINKRKLTYAALTALGTGALGLIMYPTMFGWYGKYFSDVFGFHLLWIAPRTFWGATGFWITNLGVIGIFSLMYGFRIHGKLATSALLAWGLTNLFQWRPWLWDNNKMLILTLTCMCILFCGILLQLLQRKHYVWLTLLTVLWLTDYSRGTWRLATLTQKQYAEVLPSPIVQLAKELNPPDPSAVLLYPPTHQHPCVLKGCVLFAGYPGHLYSLGVEGWYPRQKKAEEILAKSGKNWLWIPRSAIHQHNITGLPKTLPVAPTE